MPRFWILSLDELDVTRETVCCIELAAFLKVIRLHHRDLALLH